MGILPARGRVSPQPDVFREWERRRISSRMVKAQRVAIVTGASQGIGAGLVAGYRRLGFGVVATSRSITSHSDEQVLAIPGDIRDRATAQCVFAAAKERF